MKRRRNGDQSNKTKKRRPLRISIFIPEDDHQDEEEWETTIERERLECVREREKRWSKLSASEEERRKKKKNEIRAEERMH